MPKIKTKWDILSNFQTLCAYISICIMELSILFSCRLFVQPFEKQKRRSCCQPPSRKRIRSQCQSRIQQSICQPRFLQTHGTHRNHLVRIWTIRIWPNWTCCLEIFRRFWQKETKVNRTLFPPKWLFLALKYNYSYSNDVFCLQSHYFIINVRKCIFYCIHDGVQSCTRNSTIEL